MNAKQTIPILAKLAPVLAAAGPPALIGVAIGGVILWLLSRGKEQVAEERRKPDPDVSHPTQIMAPATVAAASSNPPIQSKRIRGEDLAVALEYGGRSMTRQEAVAALRALGFGKTAAYKALSENGRFAELMGYTPDGLVEWNG